MKEANTTSEHRAAVWLRAALLGALSAFAPLSIDMYLPALPDIARQYHTSASAAQFSLTACLIGLAIGQLFAGPVSDAIGRRKPLLIGLAVYALASICCACAPTIWILVGLRLLQGVAGSAGIVISRAVVRDLYSGSEMTRFFSLLMVINGLAPILAPVIGGQILRFTSWQGVFVILAAIGIIMYLCTLFGLEETLRPDLRVSGGMRQTLSTFRTLVTDKVFVGYALAQGLVLAAMFGYISGSPFVLQNIYGLSPQMFSVCFAINGLGIIVASQIAGRLAGRLRDNTIFAAGVILASAGGVCLLLVILFELGLVGILPCLFVIVSCVGIVTTVGFSLAMENQAGAAGSASALLGVSQLLLGAVTSPLVGAFGGQTAFPMGGVIAVADVAALVCFFLVRIGRKSIAEGKRVS